MPLQVTCGIPVEVDSSCAFFPTSPSSPRQVPWLCAGNISEHSSKKNQLFFLLDAPRLALFGGKYTILDKHVYFCALSSKKVDTE